MSELSPNRPIRAELLAEKMQALRDFELPELQAEIEAEPRLVEALWHIQWVSHPDNYAGGLARFAADLIADSRDLLGTHRMQEQAARKKFTASDAREIFNSLPPSAREHLTGSAEDDGWLELMVAALPDEIESLAPHYSERERQAASAREERLRIVESLLKTATLETFRAACEASAQRDLAEYLRGLCELRHFRFTGSEGSAANPWRYSGQALCYFAQIGAALLRFMDRRKAALARTIADTEVTGEIYKWLGRAQTSRRAVRIVGNSRFGKTEAVRTWCRMHPGLARLVNTPASNSESDLLREVAIALGIEVGARQTAGRLRESIDYVIRHGRLLLAFDESHLLFPTRFSRTTAPARLNWVRRSVMDAGVGCAFIATPQSYDGAKRRFVAKTAHTIEQFEERLLKTVHLPEQLADEDLLRVARIHFPDQNEDYLRLAVGKVLLAGRSFVSDLEKIAVLAREYAAEAGKASPGLAQINAAIADVLPSQPKARPTPLSPAPLAKPAQQPGNRLAEPLRASLSTAASEAPSRINFDQLDHEESPLGAPA